MTHLSPLSVHAAPFTSLIDYEDGRQTYAGEDVYHRYFSVHFGAYGTVVTLMDEKDEHVMTFEFSVRCVNSDRVEMAVLLYQMCHSALYLSGRKTASLIERIDYSAGDLLKRITYKDRVKETMREIYCAA